MSANIFEIADVNQSVNDLVQNIATSVEEQTATTNEIAQNIFQTAKAADEVSDNTNETANISQEMTGKIEGVSEIA